MFLGHVDDVNRAAVAGWAADDAQPERRLELRIEVNGAAIGRTLATRPRPDLAALGTLGDGAHGFSFEFPEALDATRTMRIRVCFPDGSSIPPGETQLRRQAPGRIARRTRPGDLPAPILVTAPGRSGTTYLMRCLAACPRIVVAELVPYEVRLLSYYAVAFQVLTAPADLARSTHPDRLMGDGFHIGFNPFSDAQYAHAFRDSAKLRDFQQNFVPMQIGAAAADTVREYYRRLAADQNKTCRLFAEKNNNLNQPTRLFMRRAFEGAKEIMIVRDPRDVLCSHLAYFSSSPDKAFLQLTHSNRQLSAIAAEARDDVCVIHYEQMIRAEAATYTRLSNFLGAAVLPVKDGIGTMFAQHATAESPEASIGRWQRDLPADLRERCHVQWGGFLGQFGYEAE